MKCSGDSEILNEIARNTKCKSEKQELIRVVSRTISCSISESPLHVISFLKVVEVVVEPDMQMGEVMVILVVLAIWAYSIAKFFRWDKYRYNT